MCKGVQSSFDYYDSFLLVSKIALKLGFYLQAQHNFSASDSQSDGGEDPPTSP